MSNIRVANLDNTQQNFQVVKKFFPPLNEPLFPLCHLVACGRLYNCVVLIQSCIGSLVLLCQVFAFVTIHVAANEHGHDYQQQEYYGKNS
jgi:hypothetical protein